MKSRVRAAMCAVELVTGTLLCGCSSVWRGMAVPPLHLKFGNGLQGAPLPKLSDPTADAPEIEVGWLETGEFYPPGCQRIRPEVETPVALIETPRAHFPSVDVCTSPNEEWSVFCESHGPSTIYHSLTARRRAQPYAQSFYTTTKATSAMWSPDNRHVALTVITGSNRSLVVCLDVETFTLSDPVYPARALGAYFTAVQLESPQFISAYRWTKDGWLVVRGAGRESVSPFRTFGYEVLVDAREPGLPTMRFLRGFSKLPSTPSANTVTAK